MPTISNPYHVFVADCERLLQERGKRRPFGAVLGRCLGPVRVLDTPGLYVAATEGRELEIVVRYVDTRTGRLTENPVAGRSAQGEMIRTHGEWVYGLKRVQRLLAGESPAEPIRVDVSCENAYAAGLD